LITAIDPTIRSFSLLQNESDSVFGSFYSKLVRPFFKRKTPIEYWLEREIITRASHINNPILVPVVYVVLHFSPLIAR
jgi:hypothetical protein